MTLKEFDQTPDGINQLDHVVAKLCQPRRQLRLIVCKKLAGAL
jgi:hypothetical protein